MSIHSEKAWWALCAHHSVEEHRHSLWRPSLLKVVHFPEICLCHAVVFRELCVFCISRKQRYPPLLYLCKSEHCGIYCDLHLSNSSSVHDLDPSPACSWTPSLRGCRGGKSVLVLRIINIFVDDFIENCAFFLELSLFLLENAIDH